MIEFFVYGILANLVAHYIIEAYEEVQTERCAAKEEADALAT